MIRLYSRGAFPMDTEEDGLKWYLPEIRAIIPLDNFNIPRSLKQFIKRNEFDIKYDEEKIEIITQCSMRESTWISERLIEGYKGLDRLGHLHSVGVYRKKKLIGGLYGVTYRAAFFGESMFSKETQASKVALFHLLNHLIRKGFVLLDVQFMTEHLRMFGAVEISFDEYRKLLIKAYETNAVF